MLVCHKYCTSKLNHTHTLTLTHTHTDTRALEQVSSITVSVTDMTGTNKVAGGVFCLSKS